MQSSLTNDTKVLMQIVLLPLILVDFELVGDEFEPESYPSTKQPLSAFRRFRERAGRIFFSEPYSPRKKKSTKLKSNYTLKILTGGNKLKNYHLRILRHQMKARSRYQPHLQN